MRKRNFIHNLRPVEGLAQLMFAYHDQDECTLVVCKHDEYEEGHFSEQAFRIMLAAGVEPITPELTNNLVRQGWDRVGLTSLGLQGFRYSREYDALLSPLRR